MPRVKSLPFPRKERAEDVDFSADAALESGSEQHSNKVSHNQFPDADLGFSAEYSDGVILCRIPLHLDCLLQLSGIEPSQIRTAPQSAEAQRPGRAIMTWVADKNRWHIFFLDMHGCLSEVLRCPDEVWNALSLLKKHGFVSMHFARASSSLQSVQLESSEVEYCDGWFLHVNVRPAVFAAVDAVSKYELHKPTALWAAMSIVLRFQGAVARTGTSSTHAVIEVPCATGYPLTQWEFPPSDTERYSWQRLQSTNKRLGKSEPTPIFEADLYAAATPLFSGDGLQDGFSFEPHFNRIRAVLRPALFPHQQQAVRWVLGRETALLQSGHVSELSSKSFGTAEGLLYTMADVTSSCDRSTGIVQLPLHAAWMRICCADGTRLYACPYSGLMTFSHVLPDGLLLSSRSMFDEACASAASGKMALPQLTNGIIADPMGWGKTVTMLAVVSATLASSVQAWYNRHPAFYCVSLEDLRKRLLHFSSRGMLSGPKLSSSSTETERILPCPKLPVVGRAGSTFWRRSVLGRVVYNAEDHLYEMLGLSLPQNRSHDSDMNWGLVACVCGAPYLDPLPPDIKAALQCGMQALQIRGTAHREKLVTITQSEADSLLWVRCSGCRRWQHAVCGGLDEFCFEDWRQRPFFCVECEMAVCGGATIMSSATIIICPPALAGQWLTEVSKHSYEGPQALKVLTFAGVKATLAELRALVPRLSAALSRALRAPSYELPEAKAFPASSPADPAACCDDIAAASSNFSNSGRKRQLVGHPSGLDTPAQSAIGKRVRQQTQLPEGLTGKLTTDKDVVQLSAAVAALGLKLSPSHLSTYDIVLTTYAALSDDIYNTDNACAEIAAHGLAAGREVARDYSVSVEAGMMVDSMNAEEVGLAIVDKLVLRLCAAPQRVSLFGPHASDGSSNRSLRHQKKYRVVPTPLLGVHWWRSVLDEAQKIDTPTVTAAIMARRLFSVNRWGMSGTPLKRRAEDLQGLLQFLDVPIYSDAHFFQNYLLNPAANGDLAARAVLLRVVHRLMWRSKDQDAGKLLGLLPLTDELVPLTFSKIEMALYMREFTRLRDCEEVSALLSRWQREERDLTASSSASAATCTTGSRSILALTPLTELEQLTVLDPLKILRQCCVHPQLGLGSGFRKTGGSGHGILSNGMRIKGMAAVLQEMVDKARVDCENTLREIVACLNGTAGLQWLQGDLKCASRRYSEVVRLAATSKKRSDPLLSSEADGSALVICVDKLQHIHAIRNLAVCLREMTDSSLYAQESSKYIEVDMASAEATGHGQRTGSEAPITAVLHLQRLDLLGDKITAQYLADAAFRVTAAFDQTRLNSLRLIAAMRLRLNEQHTVMPPSALGSAVGPSHAIARQTAKEFFDGSLGVLHASLDAVLAVVADRLLTLLPGSQGSTVNAIDDNLRRQNFRELDAVLDAANGTLVLGLDEKEKDLLGDGAAAVIWSTTTWVSLRLKVMSGLPQLLAARRAALRAAIAFLLPTESDIAGSSDCGQCRKDWGRTGPTCSHCIAGTKLRAYVGTLSGHRGKTLKAHSDPAASDLRREKRSSPFGNKSSAGALGNLNSWLSNEVFNEADEPSTGDGGLEGNYSSPTALHRVLLALARGVGRGQGMDIARFLPPCSAAVSEFSPLIDSAQSHTSTVMIQLNEWVPAILDALLSEARQLLSLWNSQAGLLSAVDELSASLTRMQLLPPSVGAAAPSCAESVYKVHAGEIPDRLAALDASFTAAQTVLETKHKPFLRYLKMLQKEEGQGGNKCSDPGASTSCISAQRDSSIAVDAALQQQTLLSPAPCSVCLQPLSNDVFFIVACGHRFCRSHLQKLVAVAGTGSSPKCPMCRQIFEPTDLPGRLSGVMFARQHEEQPAVLLEPCGAALTPVLDYMLPRAYSRGLVAYLFDPTRQRNRQAVVTDGEGPPSRLLPGEGLPVSGSFGTKIEALVRSLLALQQQPSDGAFPPVQSLVFSQFEAALTIAEAALRANGISCLRMRSGRLASHVVGQFMLDSSIQVLLMPYKTGAEGLNITCATHVFLLEPLLEPAAAQQAAGRIHRMGQTQATFVHRFFVQGTVEATVAALARQRSAGSTCSRVPPVLTPGPVGVDAGIVSSDDITMAAVCAESAHLDILAHSQSLSHNSGLASRTDASCDGLESTSAVQQELVDVDAHATQIWSGSSHTVVRGDVLALFEAGSSFLQQIQLEVSSSDFQLPVHGVED